MNWLKRIFTLQPAAVGSAASAVYLAAQTIDRAYIEHTAVLHPDLVVAGIAALYGLWTYINVTPVSRPRDKRGRALHPNQRM